MATKPGPRELELRALREAEFAKAAKVTVPKAKKPRPTIKSVKDKR